MKRKLIAISFLIPIYFSFTPLSQGLHTDADRGGHQKVVESGVGLKKDVHRGDANEGEAFRDWAEEALPGFRIGVEEEDNTIPGLHPEPKSVNGRGNSFQHFYNSKTGKGLFGVWKSAVGRAMDHLYEVQKITGYNCVSPAKDKLTPEEIRKLNDYLARIMHLIAEMCNPDHTQDRPHMIINEFENYVAKNWDGIINSEVFKKIVNPEAYYEWIKGKENWTMNDPEKFIKDLANISKDYSSQSSGMTQEQYAARVSELIGQAVLYTGGYIDAIYKELKQGGYFGKLEGNTLVMLTGLVSDVSSILGSLANATGGVENGFCVIPPQPINPAGDHPDDRFDVSDEYYWEREFKLGEWDLTNLFLRTAIKKGKIGVWYRKRFMEIYVEGRTKYKDAPQEVKDVLEEEFQALGKKLEGRSNLAESDWKGAPDVALFTNGFYNPSISLMLKIGEPVSFQDIDFDPGIVRDHPVMLVPTGGFYGLKNSEAVKARLEEYVKNGGTLVLFGQQHGYDWGLLPIPADPETGEKKPVSGYGYQEDQSCAFNSVYIDTYHPILSVFSTSTATIGVDGYFTSYPENSTVMLRRTANGQPAMILYPYGQGYVIAATLYTDFALSHHQANEAEVNLVQNIISWAKKPEALPETKLGERVSVLVSVTNHTDADGASVKFSILDPSRKNIGEQTVSLNLQPGQVASIPVTFASSSTSALGIYHIDYTLLDGQGNIVQPRAETDLGRFVVSNPPKKWTSEKPIWFSVSTSSQEVLYGSPFDYTFHIFNNTDDTRHLTIKSYLRHTARSREWSVVANPHGETIVSGTDLFIDSFWMFETMESTLYDESGQAIAKYALSFKGFLPSASVSVWVEKPVYIKGDSVSINAYFKNDRSVSWHCGIRVIVLDPKNNKIFEDLNVVFFPPYGIGSFEKHFSLPISPTPGSYIVMVEAWSGDWVVSSGSANFEVLQSQISVTPAIPSVLTTGSKNFRFTIMNTGRIGVASGVLDVSLRDPDGSIVDSSSRTFSMGAGQSITLDIPLNISPLKFGTYSLSYAQSDETKEGKPAIFFFTNAAIINVVFNETSYRVRETANLAVEVKNTGQFNLENVPLTVSVPDIGFSDTSSITLGPGQTFSKQFTILIPETTAAGQHEGNVTLTLSGASSIAQSFRFIVPESSLMLGYSGLSSLAAGDTINLEIENRGGVDTVYASEKLMINDNRGVKIYQGGVAGTILAGEKKSLIDIQIPSQTTAGPAFLNVQVKDSKTGKRAYILKMLEVTGLTSNLETKTNEDVYFKTEAITGISSIANGSFGIEGGSLKIAVTRVRAAGIGESSHFLPRLPKEGWVIFRAPSGVAVGPDGSVYVVDYYDHRIQKFDSRGNLINKWGGYGGQGGEEMVWPSGIAVGSDGLVYVADRRNNCIQKFDSNGVFIMKWGSEGSGEGQFYAPCGVTVGPNGSVYVADTWNHRIQKFTSNGSFITKWGRQGNGEGEFYAPIGIAIGGDGSVYVAEASRIQKFNSNGTFLGQWGSEGSGDGQFIYPSGIAVGPDGFIYVSDALNERIQKFSSTGTFTAKWGSYGREDGQFNSPLSIAAGPDGSIYVADHHNDRIQKFDSRGNFIMEWGSVGSEDGQFDSPHNVAIGPDGSIYVADTYNYRIQKFDREGNFIIEWGSYGSGDGQFDSPVGIAVGPDGSVLVADYYNHRVQKFDSDGNFVVKWDRYGNGEGQFINPYGIAVGSDGSVYVADVGNNCIQKFSSDGRFLTRWGSYGSGEGEFSGPSGIAIGTDGTVYVADTYNDRIQKFTSDGVFLMKWGSYCEADTNADGIPDQPCDGQFYNPRGIAIGPDGSIYVSDEWNHRIQKFDRDGNFISKWGKEGTEDGEYYGPGGIAVGFDGFLYVGDIGNNRIQRYLAEILFETDIPIDQPANITQDYISNIGTLNATGKFYLQAVLVNNLGQTLAQASYPFYVIEGNTVLLLQTDKEVYKPGERVLITGQIENRASDVAKGLALSINSKLNTQSSELLSAESFNILPGGTQSFEITTTAEAEGTVMLIATVSQNETILVEVTDRYEVAKPKVSVSMAVPDVVGNESFPIHVQIRNEGRVEATVQFGVQSSGLEDSKAVTIAAGETKIIQYQQQINQDMDYTFIFAGDLEGTVTRKVSYGLGADLAISAQAIYPEGHVAVPVTISNTGPLAETLEVGFQLLSPPPSSSPIKGEESEKGVKKSYYLAAGASITDILYFNLTEGDYQITASSQVPQASAQANFSVRKENKVEMLVSVGAQADGLIPVLVNLTNQGYNEVSGSVSVSVIEQNQTLWSSQQTVTSLPTQTFQLFTFNVNPAAMPPKSYTIKVDFLSPGGQSLAVSSSSFAVSGPVFQITQVPAYQTFYPGEEAAFSFRVKNTGNQEGAFEFRLKASDLVDLTRREWLKAGEEREIPFSFLLPIDLEQKDYFADYELKRSGGDGLRGQVKYHLAGINLSVQASLDKPYYQEGETAHLTLLVSAPTSQTSGLSLFARVNYPGYESKQSFILNSSQALFFAIPLVKITGEKLFFGIYHESGRSIHLNSLYIHKAGDILTITTDKQVYQPGEVVSVTVSGSISGNLTLSGPGGYEEVVAFAGQVTRAFVLPATMIAGTYFINAQLSNPNSELITISHPFDVAGIQVKVKEAMLDKAKYASSDIINLSLVIESNQNLVATLKTWVVDPEKGYTATETQGINLGVSQPLLATLSFPFTARKLGIHRIVYGIYSEDLLLCSGSEAFDMGEAIILGVSTDQADYTQGNERVVIAASLYGSVPASLEFFLDGQLVASQSISFSSFVTVGYTLSDVAPGRHTLKAVLSSGGLSSTKETSFVYGSALPDLVVWMSSDQKIKNGVMKVTITVTNRGRSESTPTILYLYDGSITGGSVLTTFEVKGLKPGESQTFNYQFNCLGRAGANTLWAILDPENKVFEFQKGNNEGKIIFTVPVLTLETALEKEAYYTGDTIVITGLITNLSQSPSAGVTLITAARNAAGVLVFENLNEIASIDGMERVSINTSWPTSINLPEGIYTITQVLEGRAVSTQKSVTLKMGKDFMIVSDSVIKKVEVGEAVQYILTLTSLRGFAGEVSLAIQGCPAGFTASFDPHSVSLSRGTAQTILKMIPTGQVRSGSYAMRVSASGGGRSHDLALWLELTDFQVAVLPGAQRIKQLEGATYTIALSPVNGFDSLVTVEMDGVVRGMRASLSGSQVTLPQNMTLHLATSKWLLPGQYKLTVTAKGRAAIHTQYANLVVERNPLIAPGVVTAPGPVNKPVIKAFQPDGELVNQFPVLDYRYSVHIAAGDVDGDGMDEIIVGAGSKDLRMPGLVKVFRRDGMPVAVMEVEEGSRRSRVTVACGDVDGDWVEEVAVGSYIRHPHRWRGMIDDEWDDLDGWLSERVWDQLKDWLDHRPAGGGMVKVYKVAGERFIDTGIVLEPYEKEGYQGAPSIAFGDVDGDGVPELITAPGPDPFAPAKIKVFRIDTKDGVGRWRIAGQVAEILVSFDGKKGAKKGRREDWGWHEHHEGFGANVATGDVDGDGRDEIIVGGGPDPRRNGKVIILYNRGEGLFTADSFMAFERSRFGATVAAVDVDLDGVAEIIAGLGPGPMNKSVVTIFRRDGMLLGEFQAYPDQVKFGVRVSKGTVGE